MDPSSVQLASLCYVRSNGKTLLIHKNKHSNSLHYGKWNGLGGKFESGESPEECVIREVQEESGLSIYAPRIVGYITFPHFSDIRDWYVFVFIAKDFDGKLLSSKEGELAWVPDEEIMNLPLWEGDKIFLPFVFQERFFSAKITYQEGVLVDHAVTLY